MKIHVRRPFLLLNLALILVFSGMAVSFFVFALERGFNEKSFVAYAKDDKKEEYSEGISAALGVQEAIRAVAKNNMSAVVNISTEMVIEIKNPYKQFFGDDFFREFFGDSFSGDNMKRKQQSLGSGFIIDEDGYLLSNLHVVKDATKIKVRLYEEEKEYDAEVIGVDEASDLALLKIKAKRKFPFVKLGDSEAIEIGDFAIAIGNPYGLANTMTLGIVSAKGRSEIGTGLNRYQRFIQIDVPINPGNSGGPLFNIYGEVIGVNNMIYSTGGGNIGIGFAIPINLAKNIIGQLKEKGKVTRGYLGVYPQDLTEDLAEALGVKPFSGVYVSEVVPDSPADKSGLKDGDIILSFNGEETKRAADLYRIVGMSEINKPLPVEIWREGKTKSLKISIEERESEQISASPQSTLWLGMGVSEVDDNIREKYELGKREDGVIVSSIEPSSKAASSGIRVGDVIKKINDTYIKNLANYEEFTKKNDEDKGYIIMLKRGRMVMVITIENQQ